MRAMKSRRDEDAIAQPSIADARVGVRHACYEAQTENEEWELEGRNSDGKANHDEPDIGNGVLKNMRALIGPEGELIFRMMHRVDAIPPSIPVRETMLPVVGAIEDCEVYEEDYRRPGCQCRNEGSERWLSECMCEKKPVKLLAQPTELKECNQRKEDDADEECLGDIGCDGIALRPACERPETFDGRADEDADTELDNSASSEK